MEAVILVGLQGAGKSSFYQKMFSPTHTRINLDELKTRHNEMALVVSCLSQRLKFVVDNTNATVAARKRYIEPAKSAGYAILGYFFDCPIQDCLKRNQLRSDKEKVPRPALFGTLKKLQPPSREEGFDQLFRVRVGHDLEFDVQLMEKGQR